MSLAPGPHFTASPPGEPPVLSKVILASSQSPSESKHSKESKWLTVPSLRWRACLQLGGNRCVRGEEHTHTQVIAYTRAWEPANTEILRQVFRWWWGRETASERGTSVMRYPWEHPQLGLRWEEKVLVADDHCCKTRCHLWLLLNEDACMLPLREKEWPIAHLSFFCLDSF